MVTSLIGSCSVASRGVAVSPKAKPDAMNTANKLSGFFINEDVNDKFLITLLYKQINPPYV
jgi:hypothetical protein